MKPPPLLDDPASPPAAAESEATGLPGFRTWSAVYCLVIAVFAAVVALLAALTRMYS